VFYSSIDLIQVVRRIRSRLRIAGTGNTTAAIGKGFAIGSAALVSVLSSGLYRPISPAYTPLDTFGVTACYPADCLDGDVSYSVSNMVSGFAGSVQRLRDHYRAALCQYSTTRTVRWLVDGKLLFALQFR